MVLKSFPSNCALMAWAAHFWRPHSCRVGGQGMGFTPPEVKIYAQVFRSVAMGSPAVKVDTSMDSLSSLGMLSVQQ